MATKPVIHTVQYVGASNNREYAYLCHPSIELEQRDLVVVEVRDTIGLARVHRLNVDDAESKKWASKFIVCKVDMEAHQARREDCGQM